MIPLAALLPLACTPAGQQPAVAPSPGAVKAAPDEGAMPAQGATTTTGGFEITVTPWGPDDATVASTAEGLLRQPALQRILAGTEHRLLSFRVVTADGATKERARPPTRFEATIYDYTSERTLIVTGDFNRPQQLEITQWGFQPPPTDEEVAAAVRIVSGEGGPSPAMRSLASAVRAGAMTPYLAMPGVLEEEAPDGSRRRVITIGFARGAGEAALRAAPGVVPQIIGVRLATREIIQLGAGLRAAVAEAAVCDPPPDASQATTPRYTAGQYRVTVNRGGQTLWTFLAVRPSSSSGTRGSGVELREVRYKGVKVLDRAHVPILNVHYENDACGPYRDWQYEEGRFEANGTDVAPGFRSTTAPARTILESGADTGNFAGVALYSEGQELVLVSEMEAGWYRYVSKWRMHENGTIKPQFGFAAVSNPCTCQTHFHNVYWRLDFDVNGAAGDRIEELNSPPGGGPATARTIQYEIERPRDAARQRRWRVADAAGRSYTLIPGANDGVADAYARGDLWLLRYHDGQIDDESTSTGSRTEAQIDRFDNDEYLVNQDVVVWYSAHFAHRGSDGDHGHAIVGPTLVPAGF